MISAKWVFLVLALGMGLIPIPFVTGVMVFALTWAVLDFKYAVFVFIVSLIPYLYPAFIGSWQMWLAANDSVHHIQQVAVQAVAKAQSECGTANNTCIIQKVQSNPELTQATQTYNTKIDNMFNQESYSLMGLAVIAAVTLRIIVKKKNEIRKRILPLHSYQLIRRRRV